MITEPSPDLERTAAGDTYYVYNTLGQLRFVLSPAFNKKSPSKTIIVLQKNDCIAASEGSLSLVTRSRILVLL